MSADRIDYILTLIEEAIEREQNGMRDRSRAEGEIAELIRNEDNDARDLDNLTHALERRRASTDFDVPHVVDYLQGSLDKVILRGDSERKWWLSERDRMTYRIIIVAFGATAFFGILSPYMSSDGIVGLFACALSGLCLLGMAIYPFRAFPARARAQQHSDALGAFITSARTLKLRLASITSIKGDKTAAG
ncbi:hypothetical protein LX81_03531 [Palleronia aestuarii]|uniref:Uncharacterized protein n=1 Tax=Palleronia aestuarii TaxID=568105 RepID=A0A2W7N7H3_9RHOB|nr:hypothetical protein [Palleronia aestuarii]PZX12824.1 hypothetical protein LX81_03531 [Palleronia aestuarii]